MNSVSGWSLRLTSLLVWVCLGAVSIHLAAVALISAPYLIVSGTRGVSKVFVQLLPSFAAFYLWVAPTGMLQWWLMNIEPGKASSKADGTWLLQTWVKRWPGWTLLLWLHSPVRMAKVALLLAASTAGCILFSRAFALHVDTSSVPAALVWPFGLVQGLVALSAGLDRPAYPVIHMARWRRVLDCLGSIAALASSAWLCAAAASLAVFTLTPAALPPPAALAAACLSTFMFTLLAMLSARLASIILSERLPLSADNADHARVLSLLVSRLQALPKPVDKAVTLQELALRGGYHGARFWQALFVDEEGADCWASLARGCLAELEGLCGAAAVFLKAHQASAKDAKAAKWNTSPVSMLKDAKTKRVLREQLMLEDYLSRSAPACLWASQIMTHVALLSRDHDVWGLLQMPPEGVPGLGDVVQQLLYAYALLDTYMLHRQHHNPSNLLLRLVAPLVGAAGLGSRAFSGMTKRPHGEVLATAVHACLAQSLHNLHAVFGDRLQQVRRQAKLPGADVLDATRDIEGLASAMVGG